MLYKNEKHELQKQIIFNLYLMISVKLSSRIFNLDGLNTYRNRLHTRFQLEK